MQSRRFVFSIFLGLGVLLISAWSLGPFLWQMITSLKPKAEIFAIPPGYWPSRLSLESYGKVFANPSFGRYVANSLWIGFWATLICLSVSAAAAYGLARLSVPGKKFWEKFLLAPTFLPVAVLAVPLYELMRFLGLTDKPLALILIYAALNLPFAIWMLTAFFRHVPIEIEEAALMDGLSRTGILFKILLPVSWPAMATAAILVFIFCWNEFLLALMLTSKDSTRTVAVGLAMLTGASSYEIPWDQIAAAVVVTTAPVVLLVLLFQRQIVSGLTAGAVK